MFAIASCHYVGYRKKIMTSLDFFWDIEVPECVHGKNTMSTAGV